VILGNKISAGFGEFQMARESDAENPDVIAQRT
jgi:hypothetical protein